MKPKSNQLIKFLTVCFAPAIASLSYESVSAADATWDGGGNDNLLNTATNWSTDALPVENGDSAIWNGTVAGPLALSWTGGFGIGFVVGGSLGTSIQITEGQSSTLVIGSNSGTTATNGDNFNMGNITIDGGNVAFTFGDGIGFDNTVFRSTDASPFNFLTNNSSNPATIASNVHFNSGGGLARTFVFEGSGDWNVNANLRFGNGPAMTIEKNGGGILNLTGSTDVTPQPGATTYVITDGTLKVSGTGLLGAATLTGNLGIESIFSYESSATQTISGIVSGGGTFNQTAGNLILTGLNSFNGSTTITGGTLNVSGAGSLDSLVSVDGPTARYLLTSTVASFQTIALNRGTVGGTGTLSGITVNDNAGAVVANGNGSGGSAPFTIGTLAFNGDAAITVTDDGNTATPGIVVTGTLSTAPANGTITVNASNTFWDSGVTYNLVSADDFSADIADFTLGTINGVTGRQAPSLVATATGIGLLISGDNPKWSGLDSNNWVVGSTGANSNWRLVSLNTPTNYIEGDVVLFDDSATGTTVSISGANVQPAVVNFNNSSKNFAINGPFGISSGVLNKNGTGNVTISSTNTFTGGTTLNAGTITLGGAGTLGGASNALTVTGGTLNLGGTSQTVGSLSIAGASTIQNGTLTAPGMLVSNPDGIAAISASLNLGTGGITKSGSGTLSLSSAATYSGLTTINGGTLILSGTGTLGSTSGVTLGGGSLDLGGKTINPGAVTINAQATGSDTIANGTINPTSFTFNSVEGVTTVSANITGSIGITAARLAGAPFPPPTGTLSLTGTNTFTGPLNIAGPAAVSINGGSNTGGGAMTFNSPGSSFTINDGFYRTSGISSSGYSEFRFLNLNGGTFEAQGNIFAPDFAISINLNGGTLKSGNAAGITVYDANNQVAIGTAGAFIDTSIGDITVGLNTGGAAALANPLARLNGTTGIVTIVGGNSLHSGILSTTFVDIQDESTWNLNGVESSVGGLAGNGLVTSSPGTAPLTINVATSEIYAGTISGGVSLIKIGSGTQTFSGTINGLGDTTVTAGTLEITGNTATTFADSAVVTLNNDGAVNSSGVLHLPNDSTDNIAGLVVNGTPLDPATYDANSPETTGLITGSGKLRVVGGFTSWMTQFTMLSAEERLANSDPDGDGIPNLVEYAVDGLSPIDVDNLADAFMDNSLTFNKRGDAIPFVNYGMDVSTDLGLSDPWAVVTAPDANLIENADLISYTFNPDTDGPRNFVRLKVSEK